MSIITIKNVYGREKRTFVQPMKMKNGMNYPFVKKVRYNANGDSEMILSPDELNSKEREYFIPEDEMIELYGGKTFDTDNPYERNLWEEGLTLEMINWYHNKRKEYTSHSQMKAEYPSNDIEAFV